MSLPMSLKQNRVLAALSLVCYTRLLPKSRFEVGYLKRRAKRIEELCHQGRAAAFKSPRASRRAQVRRQQPLIRSADVENRVYACEQTGSV
jgi:hypothetical protein